MPNHFHILIQVRDEKTLKELAKIDNGSEFDFHKFIMQKLSNFLNSYAKSFNKQNSRKGALCLDFTKRIEITNEFYFTRVVNYIHQNPVNHGFCKTVSEWNYSSYNSIITLSKRSKLERSAIFDWFGGIERFVEFHQKNQFIDNEIDIEN
jgi:putative transposase